MNFYLAPFWNSIFVWVWVRVGACRPLNLNPWLLHEWSLWAAVVVMARPSEHDMELLQEVAVKSL